MNGNRWVGTGHNTVFLDEGGQWWTVYHAVDQEDPFLRFDHRLHQAARSARPGRLGQRLADGQRWRVGVRLQDAGTGRPGGSAQPLQDQARQAAGGRPAPRRVTSSAAARSTVTGRGPRAATGDVTVSDGLLRWEVEHTDLYVDSNTASVLVRDAPSGDYVVETKVRLSGLPDEGCCFNYAQAGLVIYERRRQLHQADRHLDLGDPQTEFAKEINPVPEGWSRYGNTVVGPPGDDWTYLRIVVERLTGAEQREAGGDTERYTAYTSQDGVTWVRGGVWTHSLGDDADRPGLDGRHRQVTRPITAEFDYVRVYSLKGGARP